MTWYFTTTGGTMTVWDHTGAQVATGVDVAGGFTGDYPDEILDVMRESMDAGGQPTAYNQQLLADAATENIEEGTPP